MTKLRFWQGWSIGTRMIFITMLPVVFLFSSFVWYSWYSHRAQVAEELAERGRILARALAETSEYNVISGNLSDLRLTINGLVQSDKSIYRIEVLDAAEHQAISVTTQFALKAEWRYYTAPIKKQVIWVNLFSDNGAPHVSSPSDTKPPTQPAEVVGSVRVTMSPTNMLATQARRFQIELGIAALALLVSAAFALFLARSLTSPLRRGDWRPAPDPRRRLSGRPADHHRRRDRRIASLDRRKCRWRSTNRNSTWKTRWPNAPATSRPRATKP